MKTFKVRVMMVLEIRADMDDELETMEAIKDAAREAIEDEKFSHDMDEFEDEEDSEC